LNTEKPYISASPDTLNFGFVSLDNKTPDQSFDILNLGGGTFAWNVVENTNWLSCSPVSGFDVRKVKVSVDASTLPPGAYTSILEVVSSEAFNTSHSISVKLDVHTPGTDNPPIGYFDTPSDGSTVSGSIAITGWALDDIEVKYVEVKRDSDSDDPPGAIGSDGLVFIGYGTFINEARPDVAAAYPNFPLSFRSGWGYMMLTYGLPRLGNGIFRLYAFAEDGTGNRALLGTKEIICDNANRVQPFGTIDTPNQGEIVSGDYVNFGWVLTPIPNWIPSDGSTIWVSVDSVFIGQPSYNHFRQDIADCFPGYLNCNGAVGFFYLDTNQYSNGMHSIGWYAVDNEGQADGLGSRFFEIQNTGASTLAAITMGSQTYREDTSGRLKIRVESPRVIEVEQLERIKIQFRGEGGNRIIGWGEDETKSLPIGSTLDGENGVFYWSIGPVFLNRQVLHFAVTDGTFRSKPVQVIVNIRPKKYKAITEKKKL